MIFQISGNSHDVRLEQIRTRVRVLARARLYFLIQLVKINQIKLVLF